MAAEQTAAELTTRDVLLQVDRRLTLIEEDLRSLDDKVDGLDDKLDTKIEALDAKIDTKVDGLRGEMTTQIGSLRGEMIAGFSGLRGEMIAGFSGLRGDMTGQINGLHGELGSLRIETNARFERVNTRIDEVYTKLDVKIDSKFYQLVGILLVTWISTIVTVLLK